MAHVQKSDEVFTWNGRVHLVRQGSWFSPLLEIEGSHRRAAIVLLLHMLCGITLRSVGISEQNRKYVILLRISCVKGRLCFSEYRNFECKGRLQLRNGLFQDLKVLQESAES
jgi:hypothetical protein